MCRPLQGLADLGRGCARAKLPPKFSLRGRPGQRTADVVARGGRSDNEQRHARRRRSAAGRGDDAPLKLEEFLPYRLNVVASLVSQALSRIYAERYGIGVPEWRVLVTLGQYGMMTGKAIGAHSHMHKTKVSRAVALLEKRKLRHAARQPRRPAGSLPGADAGRPRHLRDLAPVALDFARRLVRSRSIPPTARPSSARSIALIERSAKLAAEFATGKSTG